KAQRIGVERRPEAGDFGAELGEVRAIRRVDRADREREPVRHEAIALAEPLELRGVVPAAAHVVFRGDLEEGDVERRPSDDLLEELPAEAEPDARGDPAR